VDVDALNLKGMNCDAATKLLDEKGLIADCQPGNPTDSKDQVGTIYQVLDGGNRDAGSTIRMTYYTDQVAIPKPQTAPSIPGTVTEGKEATVNWNSYVCPSGTGPLTSYEVTLTNAKFKADPTKTTMSFTPGTGSAVIVVDAGTAGKTVTATYLAYCGDRASDMSNSGTSTSIQPAVTDPVQGVNPPPAQ
jgi:serine/threonine-protein kinase